MQQALSDTSYDSTLEWPGDDPDETDLTHPWPPLRLRVLQSSILYRDHSLAVLDAYAETQFGRDVAPPGSLTPKIRLKEMAVSKLHATAFWDKARHEWAIVDMGSKHGTFLQSAQHPDAEPIRLSPPRMASIPRPLRHLDQLIIGSTTFLCHIHEDRVPCVDCTSSTQGVIPLFSIPKESTRAAEKRPPDMAGLEHTQGEARDAKKALTSLKRTLLARLNPPAPAYNRTPSTSTQSSTSYVDRSARRRALHPGSQFDSPGVQSQTSTASSSPAPQAVSAVRSASSRESSHKPLSSSAAIERQALNQPGSSVPGPSLPISEDNVGRRLLMKQGWQPGTSLGSSVDGGGDSDASGLIDPIEVQATAHRAGLGIPQKPVAVTVPLSFREWKEYGRERRWESLRAGGADHEGEVT